MKELIDALQAAGTKASAAANDLAVAARNLSAAAEAAKPQVATLGAKLDQLVDAERKLEVRKVELRDVTARLDAAKAALAAFKSSIPA